MKPAPRKVHLIGIGGVGMSGLAIAAQQVGFEVSGSDRERSSYTDRLSAAGISVAIGHDAANLPDGADVVVSTAIGETNPELAAARAGGSAILHRSDLLEELVATRPRCVAVAGAHGKTTTSAMVAHVLSELGEQPSFFVGGEVSVGGRVTNAAIGEGDVVVVEADESDGSFLKLSPEVAVVTNVELDHHEMWQGGLEALFSAFEQFVSAAKTTVVWRDQPRLATLSDRSVVGFAIATGRLAVSTDQGDLVATEVHTPGDPAEGTTFTLGKQQVRLGVRGEHNVLNALAALAALRAVDVSVERAIPTLATFEGVGRRFEHLATTEDGVEIYDDYAHHPTEVEAAVKTARATAAGGRVVAVFQPHLYSRTESLARRFGEALAIADVVIVCEVYPSRELAEDFPGVSGWMVATNTADAAPGKRVIWAPTFDDARRSLTSVLRRGDLCITIGAGDVFEISHELAGRG